MKQRGQVQQQYKQVKYRARKALLEQKLRREPGNCAFFQHVALKDGKAGLCGYASLMSDNTWTVASCNTEQAKLCPMFVVEVSGDELKERFDRFVSAAESGNRHAMGSLAYHYPDLAALLWVMEPWEGNVEEEEREKERGCCGSCNNCGTDLCGHTIKDIQSAVPEVETPQVTELQVETPQVTELQVVTPQVTESEDFVISDRVKLTWRNWLSGPPYEGSRGELLFRFTVFSSILVLVFSFFYWI